MGTFLRHNVVALGGLSSVTKMSKVCHLILIHHPVSVLLAFV